MKNIAPNNYLYRILVLEFNKNILEIIIKTLNNALFQIDGAKSTLEIQNFFNKKNHYDLICLDFLLTNNLGFDILKTIKQYPHLQNSKIISISKTNSIEERIKILDSGIDDYLAKPFHPQELYSRVRKLLNINPSLIYTNKEYNIRLDPKYIKFVYSDREIPLTKCEFLILKYLFEQNGFANTNSLMSFLESRRLKEINYSALSTTIKRLRDKLQRQTGVNFIKNKYGMGYYIP